MDITVQLQRPALKRDGDSAQHYQFCVTATTVVARKTRPQRDDGMTFLGARCSMSAPEVIEVCERLHGCRFKVAG